MGILNLITTFLNVFNYYKQYLVANTFVGIYRTVQQKCFFVLKAIMAAV